MELTRPLDLSQAFGQLGVCAQVPLVRILQMLDGVTRLGVDRSLALEANNEFMGDIDHEAKANQKWIGKHLVRDGSDQAVTWYYGLWRS